MIVVLNGKEYETGPGATIADLLAQRGVEPATVVVERNGDIVPGSDFASVALNDGDHLEVLRFVGGG
ncbi:sulfur carrier protein ThiS [Pseudodesulfovibrio portus]|uniref:Thiamine biosynthesis protein ThiS n=1 Tax=Pseudodesulfovibrio portus TaxID=231439 RepID=A0ABM8AP42_9BACT|nr:sulfur carrier protein ThiS [Pseudodesulfovibrio portus]BDQ33100.1 thiamine biosynthesis protein ThiS [Pseudodesulfovibrio portus]